MLQNISDEKFIQLFEGLEMNTHLESLSLTNVGLNDKTGQRLADAVEKNSTLRVLKYAQNDVYFYIQNIRTLIIPLCFNKKKYFSSSAWRRIS